ncbi:MAG: Ig-like domain-containing protein [Candidatus Micrarchaeia archaeon]
MQKKLATSFLFLINLLYSYSCAVEPKASFAHEGETATFSIFYENMTIGEIITLVCRPNYFASCNTKNASGQCEANYRYFPQGRFFIYASSPFTSCNATLSVASKRDSIPPIVDITNIRNGDTVSGITPINAAAYDQSGVKRVDILINGILVKSCPSDSCVYLWNTTGLPPRNYTISAVAYDSQNNSAATTTVVRTAEVKGCRCGAT